MYIIDEEIKNKKIIKQFKDENLGSISYDLTFDKVEEGEQTLEKGDFAIVKMKESIEMPYDLVGQILEKNSLLRIGIQVNGPLYQPGHKTNIYLRLINHSNNKFIIEKNMKLAHIAFIKLDKEPNITYDKQFDSSFNNEEEYKKTGNYNYNF